jgi:Dolichyl-phosphate-mannose-protein mannosyltransferase
MGTVAPSRTSHRGEKVPERFVDSQAASIPAAERLPWTGHEKLFVLMACVLFLVISIGVIRTESLTDNELLFLPAGISYLEQHDARMDIQEPPLIKIIAALPSLLFRPKIDFDDPAWTEKPASQYGEYFFGTKFFESWNPHHQAMLFAARLPMIGLTLLLGLSLYYMARQLAGPWGAMLTLALFVTSPFFIAYGSIVHMDVPVVLFSVWTMWFFASLWQNPTRRNALFFALSLAGALVTKFSGVFLFPAIGLAWIWFRYRSRDGGRVSAAGKADKDRFRREGLSLGAMILAAGIVFIFYSATFYRSDVSAILNNESASNAATGYHVIPIDILARRITNHPALKPILLAPSLYVGGLAYVLSHGRRPMFFLGHMNPHGVWYYFPVISFLKLPPGMLLAVALLVALTIARFLGNKGGASSVVPRSHRFHFSAIVACLIVFAGIAMASSLNIGIRHFSVPISLTVLLCSFIIPLTQDLSQRRRMFSFATTVALAFSCVATAALTYPHYLSYFNMFRLNTPKQDIAANSNLNWGQSMEEVASFFREHGVSGPYVDSDASTVNPVIYMPGAINWTCNKPDPSPPAWVAVSTYNLTRQTPNCLRLLRYPSWKIGDGAAVVFHITGKTAGS